MTRAQTALAIALCGLGITSLCFYPGFMNNDAAWQLHQAREGLYNDMHPPLMAWVWSFLDSWIPGPGGMFLLQATLFWAGLALFMSHAIPSRRVAAVLSLGVGLYVPVLCAFGMVVKDAGFTGALVFSTGCLLDAERRSSKLSLAAGLLGMGYAVGLRHNGLAAILPLCVWACRLVLARAPARLALPGWRGVATPWGLGLALSLLLYLGGVGLERLVIRPAPLYLGQSLLLHDIVGVSVRTRVNYLPDFYAGEGEPFTLRQLRRVYNPIDGSPLVFDWTDGPKRRPGFLPDPERQLPLLFDRWLSVISTEPSAYLTHRVHMFAGILGIAGGENWPYWFQTQLGEDEPPAQWNDPWKHAIRDFVLRHRNAAAFRAWPYVAGIAAFGVLGLRLGVRQRRAFFALAGSALLYEGAYFLIAPSAQFRYSWWAVITCLLLACLVRWPSPRRTATSG